MHVVVLRLLVLAVLGACALACSGSALATPPVFAVVPDQAVGPQTSLNAAIERRIAADRHSLAQALRSEHQNIAAARRADSTTTSANLFASEDLAGRLRLAATADAARAGALRRSIAGLEQALRPVVLPAASTSSSTLGAYAVAIAERYLGVRYLWGGAGPALGFDCSGFVKYVYAQLGIALPHYAASQWTKTMHVDPSQLAPGDLVFFEPKSDGPGHVGMYVGNGVIIQAPHTGTVVQFASLASEAAKVGFVGASRPSA